MFRCSSAKVAISAISALIKTLLSLCFPATDHSPYETVRRMQGRGPVNPVFALIMENEGREGAGFARESD